jgi:hypothetical protein
MLEQTITCDICGLVGRRLNQWFVVYDQAGELRIKTWTASDTLIPGAKHLCGQNCLFKLIEEFLANHAQPVDAVKTEAKEQVPQAVACMDSGQDSAIAHTAPVVDIGEYGSATGLVTPPEISEMPETPETPAPSPAIHKPRHAATR